MDELTALVEKKGRERRTHIRKDVDAKFRKGLLYAVQSSGGGKAMWHIQGALYDGPSRGGLSSMMAYFGFTDLSDPRLAATAPIIDGLEVSMPGFKKWLELSGFGNDKRMIKGFLAWAEHDNEARFVPAAARVHEDYEGQMYDFDALPFGGETYLKKP